MMFTGNRIWAHEERKYQDAVERGRRRDERLAIIDDVIKPRFAVLVG